jgi:hypothetical protein
MSRAFTSFCSPCAADKLNHMPAKLYLGVMYAEGRGVPQDYVRLGSSGLGWRSHTSQMVA